MRKKNSKKFGSFQWRTCTLLLEISTFRCCETTWFIYKFLIDQTKFTRKKFIWNWMLGPACVRVCVCVASNRGCVERRWSQTRYFGAWAHEQIHISRQLKANNLYPRPKKCSFSICVAWRENIIYFSICCLCLCISATVDDCFEIIAFAPCLSNQMCWKRFN